MCKCAQYDLSCRRALKHHSFIHSFIHLFAAEFEEPKIGISG